MTILLPTLSQTLFNRNSVSLQHGLSLLDADDISGSTTVPISASAGHSLSPSVSASSQRPNSTSAKNKDDLFRVMSQFTENQSSGIMKRTPSHVPRKSSWGTDIPPPVKPGEPQALGREAGDLEEIDLDFGVELTRQLVKVEPRTEPENGSTNAIVKPLVAQKIDRSRRPFHRWMETFRRKSPHGRQHLAATDRDRGEHNSDFILRRPGSAFDGYSQTQSSSSSSMAFVTAVKTASISLVSFGGQPSSRRIRQSTHRGSATRSSKFSDYEARQSLDSNGLPAAVIEDGITERAIRRRNVLEELLSSEESYIADLKILINVYFTLLASVPTVSPHTRTSIQRNVNEILQLHEELYGELHGLISQPASAYIPSVEQFRTQSRGHLRWHSLDVVPEVNGHLKNLNRTRRSADFFRPKTKLPPAYMADPKLAADVARIFDKTMRRFFTYEEYGAKYEMMVQDVASTYKTVPTWRAYEKGIEALAEFLTSINNRDTYAKKGLTFSDLLIKPIQRICKYPLLFADLYKETPIYDCPESHRELEKVLYRLRETAREINRATDDPRTRSRIEKTWLLQDRLIFKEQPESSPALALRLLGHIILCGVLHVTWRSEENTSGEYMACMLFRSRLLLATVRKGELVYTVTMAINLADARIEEIDNGRGLQCHSALYSWKFIFESDHRLFEVIFSACSAKEEDVWRACLSDRITAETGDCFDGDSGSPDFLSFVAIDIKPIGNVFGQAGTLARRISLHRAGTVGPKSNLRHVVINNTHALRDGQDSMDQISPSLNRCRSMLQTGRIPVISPKRAERVRLEAALADVWTRDTIPYPGINPKRSEHMIRNSASSVMRKLSMASITSSFSKRSTSYHEAMGALECNPTRKSADGLSEKFEQNHIGGMRPGLRNRGASQQLAVSRKSSAHGFRRSKSVRALQTADPFTSSVPESPISNENEKVIKDPGQNVRKRWSNPSGLGKAFSSDGLRKFFV